MLDTCRLSLIRCLCKYKSISPSKYHLTTSIRKQGKHSKSNSLKISIFSTKLHVIPFQLPVPIPANYSKSALIRETIQRILGTGQLHGVYGRFRNDYRVRALIFRGGPQTHPLGLSLFIVRAIPTGASGNTKRGLPVTQPNARGFINSGCTSFGSQLFQPSSNRFHPYPTNMKLGANCKYRFAVFQPTYLDLHQFFYERWFINEQIITIHAITQFDYIQSKYFK